MAPASLIKFAFIQSTRTTERTLFQILAGYKLELGAMIASDWPFGLQTCAWLTYGQASLTFGHYLRVEEEGNEQMRKM